MKGIAKNKRYISPLVSISLLIMVMALSSCSQENKEKTRVVADNDQLKTITVPVDGMTCSACVSRVKKSLRSIDGVTEVSVSLKDRNARVLYISGKTSSEQIVKAIDDLGYKAGTPKQE